MSKSFGGKRMQDEAEDFSDRADEAKDRLRETAENAIDTAGAVVSTLNRKLKAAGVDTDAIADAAKDQATDLQKMIIAEVEARPLRTLAIAAGVGVLFGLFVTR